MNELQEVICIICPKGCHIEVDRRQEPWEFSGNSCKRGPIYAQKSLPPPAECSPPQSPLRERLFRAYPWLPVATYLKSA